MNLTDDDILRCQAGIAIPFKDICFIYPSFMHEIITIGYSKFQSYLGLLTSHKPEIKNKNNEMGKILDKLTDFQYLVMLTSLDPQINKLLTDSLKFFIHEDVSFSLEPAQIIIGNKENGHFLIDEDFADFQNFLRHIFFLDIDGSDIIINANDSELVKKMKRKMIKNREQVRLAKARQAQREGTELKFSDLIASITLNNSGLNMENIWHITYYALQDQLKRMGWRDQFNINHQAALAGAKIQQSQLKHWIRSIGDSTKE